jgi:hypothetical protein
VDVWAKAHQKEEWLAFLRGQGIRFLAVGPLMHGWDFDEIRWVRESDKRFERAFGTDWMKETVLFRIDAGQR